MAKRKANTTRYDNRSRKLQWRLEWTFPEAGVTCANERVDGTEVLAEVRKGGRPTAHPPNPGAEGRAADPEMGCRSHLFMPNCQNQQLPLYALSLSISGCKPHANHNCQP